MKKEKEKRSTKNQKIQKQRYKFYSCNRAVGPKIKKRQKRTTMLSAKAG